MAQEHDIVTDDGIEILIKVVDEKNNIYTAHSESSKFFDIFGTQELRIQGAGEDLADFIKKNVLKEHQPKAMEIVEAILNAL